MSISEQDASPPVSGDDIMVSKLKYSFFLVCGLLVFALFSTVGVIFIVLSVDAANPSLAIWELLFIPPAILFGWFSFIVARSLYLGLRLVVGKDRIQLVVGQSSVKGEILFDDIAEVTLVEIDTDSWNENTVGFRFKDPTKASVNWPYITRSLTWKLNRWINRKSYGCDLTVGLGWQSPTEMYDIILRSWKAFQSEANERST
jgi:membrane protein implicated in regulation of membrane protease activity